MQMGTIKCKMCGSNLETGDSVTVCKCDSCGTSQTVPDIADDKELKLFERANKLRFNCDYDKALGVYDNITDDYPEEAEGYWGKILCKYGIEYVEDEKTSSMCVTEHLIIVLWKMRILSWLWKTQIQNQELYTEMKLKQ